MDKLISKKSYVVYYKNDWDDKESYKILKGDEVEEFTDSLTESGTDYSVYEVGKRVQ